MDQFRKNYISEEEIVSSMNQQADKLMLWFLMAYSLFGVGISVYYGTWLIGLSVAALCMLSWFVIKWLLPDKNLHRYVASAFFGVFVGTFIYQMHGLFEMHFFAFIGSAILIIYQNWKLQIPLILVVVLHHAAFAYLQYSGIPDIFFTQLQYMDLQTFIYHASLAATVVVICGYWAHRFRSMTIMEAIRSQKLSASMEEMQELNNRLQKISKALQSKNVVFEQKNKELEESKSKLISITEKQADLYRQLREGKLF